VESQEAFRGWQKTGMMRNRAQKINFHNSATSLYSLEPAIRCQRRRTKAAGRAEC
jgi:hypothetical protein